MRKQWHIQTRVLLTLVGLTTAILLAVGLAFNLSIQGYIRSRVSAQLVSVSVCEAEEEEVSPAEPAPAPEPPADAPQPDAASPEA